MKEQNDLKLILATLQSLDKRISLLEGKHGATSKASSRQWYKSGSTIDKVITLVNEKFFDQTKSIGEITEELKTKDFHLSASDLTLPLRKIVRKGILRKTKTRTDGSASNKWLYEKV